MRHGTLVLSIVLCLLLLAESKSPIYKKNDKTRPFQASDKYAIYYGASFNSSIVTNLKQYDLIIINPSNQPEVTPATVADLQGTSRTVLCYISIGEDNLPSGNQDTTSDPIGPTSWDPVNKVVVNKKSGGTFEYSSFYMDYKWDGVSRYVSDGIPDRNGGWNSYYVYPNAAWRSAIKSQRIGGKRGLAGLDQLLGSRVSATDTNRTNNFGCDGLFLDTIDTASVVDNTTGAYPFAVPEMTATIKYISDNYPTALLVGNRGLFYFDYRIQSSMFNVKPFDYNIRPYINGIMFESYTLGTGTTVTPDFCNNRCQAGFYLGTEANRKDGFTVLVLDYAGGKDSASITLSKNEARRQGWPLYQDPSTAWNIATLASSVITVAADTSAPSWGVAADSYCGISSCSPTTGVQAVVATNVAGQYQIYWNGAIDQTSPVSYNVLVSTSSSMANATVYQNVDYTSGYAPPALTYTACFKVDLGSNAAGPYYFKVTSSAGGLTDTNSVVQGIFLGYCNAVNSGAITIDGNLNDWATLPALAPDSTGDGGSDPDFTTISVAHDVNNVYIRVNSNSPDLEAKYNSANDYLSLYVDSDDNRNTGFWSWISGTQGFDFFVQGAAVYSYVGANHGWGWNYIGGGSIRFVGGSSVEYSIPRSALGLTTGNPSFKFVLYGKTDIAPNVGQAAYKYC
eukprot:TRINITY_DN118_c1_g1_i1.p1 TRINITY_DN118_c1_g1~~TRINITY_DN118_c1_g1_i1.p1  ORF type:complete len:692 (-),score=140.40 TRINITY_DN118_c1_g1_i1:101-2137(-)